MLFLALSLAVVAVLYGFTGWRLLAPLHLGLPAAAVAWATVLALAALPHSYLLFLRGGAGPAWLRQAAAWAAFLGLGFAATAFCLVVVRDLAWLAWSAAERLAQALQGTAAASASAAADVAAPSRRQFLVAASGAGVAALAGVLCGYGLYCARRRPTVTHVRVPVTGLPPGLDGLRIAQISDLHVGPTIRRPFVEEVVAAANAADPDIVAFTGDLADGTVAELAPHVAPLAGLNSRLGRFFVTGNHEYYSELEPWLAHARHLGFDVLVNEHRVLGRAGDHLVLAGVPDQGGGHFRGDHAPDPAGALAGAPAAPRLVLAHQPVQARAAAAAGADLVLSGHTHGGQFVPWKYIVPLQQPWTAGLHRVDGACWVYVSRGAGYWGPPLRLGAPSEVTCLTLARA